MRIAILVTRPDKPSARYRVLQYIPYLEKEGFRPVIFVISKKHLDRACLFRKIKNFDIVFLQKKLFGSVEWNILRHYAKRLIYDFDDAVMFRDPGRGNFLSDRRMKNFRRTVKNADLVIAGNEYLKNFSMKENSRTFVVPTSVDMKRYAEKPFSSSDGSIMLGWIGSSATLSYLERMRDMCDSVFDRFPDTKLKIVADRFFDCERMPVIKKQWRYEDEIADLHTFSIGLMPLTDDLWSRGKCGFKLLQYMAVGVPAVCSPVGVNREIVTNGENGFWASAGSEWVEKIGELAEDRRLRSEMGKRARRTVIERYSAEKNYKKIAGLLRDLMDEGPADHADGKI